MTESPLLTWIHHNRYALVLILIVVLAAFARLYQLEPFGWVPDHFDRFEDAQRITSGQVPHSRFYPQGPSLLFALPVAIWPSIVATQVTTGILGVGLVLFAYAMVIRLTGDRIAALVGAALVAFHPLFVLAARQGYVDIINAFFIVGLVLGLPMLARHPSSWGLVTYGVAIGLLIAVRPTNLVLVPVLALYWLLLMNKQLRIQVLMCFVISRPVLVVSATIAACIAVSIVGGSWFGGGYSSGMISADDLLPNMLALARSLFGNVFGAMLLLPATMVGTLQLWRTNRPLLITLALFFFLWSVVHLPFHFFNHRYMLPLVFFLVISAAVGWPIMWRASWERSRIQSIVRRYALVSSIGVMVIFIFASSLIVFRDWREWASNSDAGMGEKITPALQQLQEGTLLISTVADAVRSHNPHLEYIDLFDLSIIQSNKRVGAAELSQEVYRALESCNEVYYLYSQSEARTKVYGGVWDDFSTYFVALASQFTIIEGIRIERTIEYDPWVLYRVQASRPVSNCPI